MKKPFKVYLPTPNQKIKRLSPPWRRHIPMKTPISPCRILSIFGLCSENIRRSRIFSYLIGGMLIFASAFPTNAEVFTVRGSCDNNSLTVEIEGVSNLELNYSTQVFSEGTWSCDYHYLADFPMPGKTVSIKAHLTPAVSDELHSVGLDFDGIYAASRDYNNGYVDCLSPPIANYQPLDDLSISAPYTECTYPLTSGASSITWEIVDCNVSVKRMRMTTWTSIRIHARESYCAGNPLECPWT